MSKDERVAVPWERIFADYQPDPLNDDEYIYRIKEALMRLPEPDRNLLIIYSDLGSYSSVAKRYHLSVTAVRYKVEEVRRKLFRYDTD
jgi:DNA-directed RNA polymerase specialized sigma24 family protein